MPIDISGDGTINGLVVPNETGTLISDASERLGRVVQVARASTRVPVSNTSNTVWADTGLSIDFTPKFADSQILIAYNIGSAVFEAGLADDRNGISFRLLRNGVEVYNPGFVNANGFIEFFSSKPNTHTVISRDYIDSAQDTLNRTYKVQFISHFNGGIAAAQSQNHESSITLMEIAQE